MSELNLLPQELKIEREERTRHAVYMLLAVVILMAFIIAVSIPLHFINKMEEKNKALELNIQMLSSVTDTINKLNAQKVSAQDKMNIVEGISKYGIRWTTVIKDISALIPEEISVDNISLGKDIINLQCTSKSRQAVAVFMINIQNSKQFILDKIGSITPVESTEAFRFALSFKLNNDESKVK